MKALIFDVETTGLLPRNIELTQKNIDLFPNIVQFSWIIYDSNNNTISNINDHIIKLNQDIPEETIKIHGITNEKMKNDGVDIGIVLNLFTKDMLDSDILVAHNINFDKSMIAIEYLKNNRINWIGRHRKYEYCTMKRSLNICNIYKKNEYTGERTKKYPKLMELHYYWFKTIPNNLHNSLIDVFVCFRCYYQMEYKSDIMEKHNELNNYYKEICAL